MERTLIFFKPDAIYRNIVCKIYEEFIVNNGFKVVSIKPVIVTKNMILEHYKKNLIDKSSDVVNRVIEFYEGKFILLMVLERENAVSLMRKLLGSSDPAESDKSTIRGKYGDDSYKEAEREKRSCRNIMHASDSYEAFLFEYSLWFE